MGSSISQVQSPQTSGGKGSPQPVQQSLRADGLDQNAINADPGGYQQFRQIAARQGYNYGPQDMSTQNMPSGGKGASGQRFTYSPTSGQPQIGRPNQYTNTVGQWDNASIQPSSQPRSGGKGKG
jgi:hypothetical protein